MNAAMMRESKSECTNRNRRRNEEGALEVKKLFNHLYYKWLAITFLYIIVFHTLDYIFSVSTSVSVFEYGFLAFVTMWCEQQDNIKKEGD